MEARTPEDGAISFGDVLRDLRLAAGLSQEVLAERARMSTGGISVLERGIRRFPQRDTVAQLADALALSAGDRRRLEAAAARPQQARRRKPAATVPHNLPTELTSFIGRQEVLAEIESLVHKRPLVTLVGSGGIGKTRLAARVGTELLECYADGVWFVDFAAIADPELVASVIAQTLGVRQREGHRVGESIPRWLERKQLLLIFDNCEHVVETVAPIAAEILRTAPDVRILSTSRQALSIGGEEVVRIPSLDVPHGIADLSASKVMEFAAVELFVARATTANRSFVVTDDTAPIVAEICRRLDGIPLAIELAAARVKVLSIPHLAERLNERFKLLTGGSRDVLPRQRTLHALIDWSYDLLSAPEQLLLTRLGAFASGFDFDAATSICGGDGLDDLEILDLLGSLTDKSLVIADTSGDKERYRLLESTAAYALEKLAASGQRERMARRHAEYFRDEAQAAGERIGAGSTVAWRAGVLLELDNYRAALEWALTQQNDPVIGGAIAGSLSGLWHNAGLPVEGRYWIGLALERVSEAEQPRVAGRLHLALSLLSSGRRRHEEAERAMELYESVGDTRRKARAQQSLAFALYQARRLDEASEANAQSLAASRECGDTFNVAGGLNMQGMIEKVRGNRRLSRDLYAQALATYKALGNEKGTAIVLDSMAELEFADGRPEEALRFVNEALDLDLRGKSALGVAIDYVNSAAYRIALGDVNGAREAARKGLEVAREEQADPTIAISLQHLALVAGLGDDPRRAARLLGYVDAEYNHVGMKRELTEQWGYDKLMTALREALSLDEIAELAAEGAAWDEDRAVEEALKA